jgi:uncharacterized BrkB/YihY/UPF0761 family membrane protein
MDTPGQVPDAPADEASPGRLARLRSWATSKADQAAVSARAARQGHASVDIGFRLADRDKEVAAAVLAGGVAYRFFFWLLSCFLFLTGGLGFGDGHRVTDTVTASGLNPQVAHALTDSWRTAQQSRWWLLLVGAWLVLWTGYMAAKALALVHAVVWDLSPPRVKHRLQSSLAFTVAAFSLPAAMAGARWVREQSPGYGITATIAVALVPLVFWIVASRWLPHADVGWLGLLPGAVLFAAGVEALHLFTVFYLDPKLNHATELYGVLGIAATILFWLYITGRLVVAAAMLNASLYERHSSEPAGPA